MQLDTLLAADHAQFASAPVLPVLYPDLAQLVPLLSIQLQTLDHAIFAMTRTAILATLLTLLNVSLAIPDISLQAMEPVSLTAVLIVRAAPMEFVIYVLRLTT